MYYIKKQFISFNLLMLKQEGCVRQAEECVRQARLVALQIQLLPNRTRVLSLDTPALTALVSTLPKISYVSF